MNDLTIPVVIVAAELGVTAEQLVAKLDPNDILLGAAGMRVLETATAARVISEHRAAEAAARRRDSERRAARASAAVEQGQGAAALRRRVAAIRAHQADLGMADRPLAEQARARVVADAVDERLTAAGERFAEMARGDGTLTYHRITD